MGASHRTNPFTGQWVSLLTILAGFLFIGIAVWMVLSQGVLPSSSAPLRVGAPLPSSTFLDVSGKTVHLADFQAKVVLVNIWATWCPPCRAEMPDLQAYYTANQARGFVLIGLNAGDSQADIQDFAANYQLTFPMLMDPSIAWVHRLGVYDYPTSILIGRDGLVKNIHIGKYTPTTLAADVDPLLK